MPDPSTTPAPDAAPQATPEQVARAEQLERRIAELEATHRERLVRAELKAEAVRQGMVDLDGLKVLDSNSVDCDDQGEVRNAAGVMRDLKRAKPWLFGLGSSSSTAAAPAAAPAAPRTAMRMSHAEWQTARAELLRRR